MYLKRHFKRISGLYKIIKNIIFHKLRILICIFFLESVRNSKLISLIIWNYFLLLNDYLGLVKREFKYPLGCV